MATEVRQVQTDAMGFYRDQVLPRFQDKVMGRKPNRPIRERVCAGLQGTVLEIGFGTGLNAYYYSPGISKVVAIEPSAVCMKIAKLRIDKTTVPVEYGGLTGERLDLPDDEFDAVLSTWTLCTIPNMDAALAELRRVLKPGGKFHFVEHGHSPDEKVARIQHRIEPVNKLLAGGCHLTRNMPVEIERAGFTIDKLDTYYFKGEPKPMGYTYEGVATPR